MPGLDDVAQQHRVKPEIANLQTLELGKSTPCSLTPALSVPTIWPGTVAAVGPWSSSILSLEIRSSSRCGDNVVKRSGTGVE